MTLISVSMNIFEWMGALLVLLSIYRYGLRCVSTGAFAAILGNCLICIPAAYYDFWAVFALCMITSGIHVFNMRREYKRVNGL